jgi:nucleoside-diphosphate-sugar epimerase
MKVLLVGGNGFVGQALITHKPSHITADPTYCHNPPSENTEAWTQLDLLRVTDWNRTLSGYDAVLICARPKGTTLKERDSIALETKTALTAMMVARLEMNNPPHVFALHGTLSYGDCGQEIVEVTQAYNPTGYATSYGIGEEPLRHEAEKGMIGIMRAPWILGNGSWFNALYCVNQIPLFSGPPVWMAIVEVNDLAKQIWHHIERKTTGIIHPQLLVRTTQERFAAAVGAARLAQPVRMSKWRMLRLYDKQTRQSVLASIRLASGQEMNIEGDAAHRSLDGALQSLFSGRS